MRNQQSPGGIVMLTAAVVLLSGAVFTHKWLQARDRAEAARRFADEQRDAPEEHSYVSHLLDAGRHLAEGDPENARELLRRHRQEPSGRDLRGWEWFHLLGQFSQDLRAWRELAAACTHLGWAGRARSALARAQKLAPDDLGLRSEAEDAEAGFARAFEPPSSQ